MNEAFTELSNGNVTVHKIHKVDKDGEVVRLNNDKSIEVLTGQERLVFFITSYN
jgi:hypothetical protein